jgi:S-DNA-T family DNA segregation ATPase FtsK/SpoIIIE
MAKKASDHLHKKSTPKLKLEISKKNKVIIGFVILIIGLSLSISFISFLNHWQEDQSVLSAFLDREVAAKNALNKLGAALGYFFVYKGLGLSALILSSLVCISGFYIFLSLPKKSLYKIWFWGLYSALFLSITLGFTVDSYPIFGGVMGFEIKDIALDYLGSTGLSLSLSVFFIIFIVRVFNFNPQSIGSFFARFKTTPIVGEAETENDIVDPYTHRSDIEASTPLQKLMEESEEQEETAIASETTIAQDKEASGVETVEKEFSISDVSNQKEKTSLQASENLEIEVAAIDEEEESTDNLSNQLLKDFGAFDPTLELSNYKFPSLDLLEKHGGESGITINEEELEENKVKIVETLKNYNIGIAQIKATIGPTVTLYEIVPDAGVRISKIKNLEDDIALSLAALGIRIIAPIPGKGTIGIEVPNKNPSTVSMRSVIASAKFQNAAMELPIAFGKTISNETFVVDLAKMPHMLMAGATGQGKSVGLNAVLTSLLYKKHPAEVKFVLVDPKKVELTLFNKIERHYLAKLPDVEDAIITDNTKVIHTLNSLCIEMDNRYELLKHAMVRNIKEYNTKFKARKLNPNDGHKFLPYIVLVIDEFADLIMTAGKEVETPIARLAQLARAIGIHLIVATQRPSVNVITGIIKANFPARIAFRVTSKIDSRTILDSQGADQLIGRGDMLYTQGNDVTRIQCAFVDTPEVEKITDFIGSQRAYPEAYLLPEYIGEENGSTIDYDISERDAMFREAAEVIVIAQQGSASLIQRKLKLGYNRAGRIVDQLEAAGIVGPFEGSKARQVLVQDMVGLQQLLDNETQKDA